MGVGGQKGEMHEIPETRAAARDEAFEKIIERIKTSGGEIEKDETAPLYIDIGAEEHEIGTQRTVIFNLNKFDFKLVRKVEDSVLQGSGRQKHIEELETPRINISLYRKSQYDDNWQSLDLEDMF